MIALTPTPAKTEPTIERQRTRACGYAPLMMFRHARLTASSRSTWQQIPSASAPQANSPSRSRKTSVAFQISWNSFYGTATEAAYVACRRRPRSFDCASVNTATARPPANEVEM